MTLDPFMDRFVRVRHRFATSVTGKIDQACATVSDLSASETAAATAVDEAYRCVHGIVGVGPTIGFPASGKAAHDVEDVLRPPHQQRRGLSAEEIARLTAALQVFREVAARELRSFQSLQS